MRLLWILCLYAGIAAGQEGLLPQYEGEALLERLYIDYKPQGLMSYGETRDTMYRNVYRNENGHVTCYYSGHSIFLPDNVDPTSFLYNDGHLDGITAEHIYPQSKGADEGDARSDMHSLVPAIWRVNEARSNYPFGEVPDEETDHWYRLTEDSREIPITDIELYSERLNGGFGHPGLFEPRESVKGDIARAVFYFYTMYKEEADAADPDFFHDMKEVLLTWHIQDPVDSLEYQLNFIKAKYQQGNPNPYILDCTLVQRAYFSELNIDSDCIGSFTSSIQNGIDVSDIVVYPNPVSDILHIDFPDAWEVKEVTIRATDGTIMMSGALDNRAELNLSPLSAGMYLLTLEDASGNEVVKRINKL